MTLRISSELHAQLLAAAEGSPCLEICGLIMGHGDRITHIVPTANIAMHPARAFELEPTALFDALRAERDGGARLIGYYHSHPVGPAAPSASDAAHASVDGRVWLIIGQEQVTAWLFQKGHAFRPVALFVID